MKKLGILLVATLMSLTSFSQAINDNAVIPVSVTLNSIMRLQVISGGNIEFVFNTIDSYRLGIGNTARYTTVFTVASSVNFDVTVNLEEPLSFPGEALGDDLPLSAILFELQEDTGNGESTLAHSGAASLIVENETIVTSAGLGNGGTPHQFSMLWECGTAAGSTMKELNLPADRYSNNVYLTLTQAP